MTAKPKPRRRRRCRTTEKKTATKKRAVRNVSAAAASASEELQDLAIRYYEQNTLSNLHGTQAKHARESLKEGMDREEIDSFAVEHGADILDVTISGREMKVVDVGQLREAVPHATFMAIVSATQKAVIEHAGQAIADKVSRPVESAKNVNIKKRKRREI